MKEDNRTLYEKSIQDRSTLRFICGLIPRIMQYLKHERARRIARKRGAMIGKEVILPLELARRANKNLVESLLGGDLKEYIRVRKAERE